jgi:hypothetical protein
MHRNPDIFIIEVQADDPVVPNSTVHHHTWLILYVVVVHPT